MHLFSLQLLYCVSLGRKCASIWPWSACRKEAVDFHSTSLEEKIYRNIYSKVIENPNFIILKTIVYA